LGLLIAVAAAIGLCIWDVVRMEGRICVALGKGLNEFQYGVALWMWFDQSHLWWRSLGWIRSHLRLRMITQRWFPLEHSLLRLLRIDLSFGTSSLATLVIAMLACPMCDHPTAVKSLFWQRIHFATRQTPHHLYAFKKTQIRKTSDFSTPLHSFPENH
jgi:hypothetical protein